MSSGSISLHKSPRLVLALAGRKSVSTLSSLFDECFLEETAVIEALSAVELFPFSANEYVSGESAFVKRTILLKRSAKDSSGVSGGPPENEPAARAPSIACGKTRL